MKKIMVVDDDNELLETIKTSLENKKFKVLTLNDGEKVMSTVSSFKPDVILLDVYLGKTYGVNICNRLRLQPETKDIPVVLLSGYSKSDVLEKCAADGLIQKPFTVDALSEIIKRQLS
jgi:CheY-like chemotaxis protein